MGCLSVKYARLGCISINVEPIGGIYCEADKIGDINVCVKNKNDITCRFSLICKTNVSYKYLEINPEIIWVYPDWSAYNDVISNTRWNVN